MTSQTIDAPRAVRATPAPVPSALWRRAVARSVLVPLATLAPLIVPGPPSGLPVRLLWAAGAVVLAVTAMLAGESLVCRGRLFRQPPSRLATVVPLVAAAGCAVAAVAGPASPGGWAGPWSAAVVFAVAAAVCRIDRDRHRLGPRRVAALVAAGALVAWLGGVAWLALPFATVAVAARGVVVLIGRWQRVAVGAPARAVGLLWLGFLPVYATVPAAAGAPLGSAPDGGPAWVTWLVALPAAALLAGPAVRAGRDQPWLSRLDRLQLGGVALAAGALVLLGAAVTAVPR